MLLLRDMNFVDVKLHRIEHVGSQNVLVYNINVSIGISVSTAVGV